MTSKELKISEKLLKEIESALESLPPNPNFPQDLETEKFQQLEEKLANVSNIPSALKSDIQGNFFGFGTTPNKSLTPKESEPNYLTQLKRIKTELESVVNEGRQLRKRAEQSSCFCSPSEADEMRKIYSLYKDLITGNKDNYEFSLERILFERVRYFWKSIERMCFKLDMKISLADIEIGLFGIPDYGFGFEGECPINSDFTFEQINNLAEQQRLDKFGAMLESLMARIDIESERNKTNNKSEKRQEVELGPKPQRGKKTKKKPKDFKAWNHPEDTCFVIEGNKIKFNHVGKLVDLRLKNDSQTHKLLFLLSSGSLTPSQIKKAISPDSQNKASKIVEYANVKLNKIIPRRGLPDIPSYDIAFILRDQNDDYCSAFKILERSQFDRMQIEQSM